MAHHTTKEELKKWSEAVRNSGGYLDHVATGKDLLRLIRDASQLHDLDEIHEYTRAQPDRSPEDWKVMVTHCAADCADKDYDIAKLEKQVADLKKKVVYLEAEKPN